MSDLVIVKKSKNFLKKMSYNVRYGRKFKKFNIDKRLSEALIENSDGSNEKAIFELISKSKNKEGFESNVKNYLKTARSNTYASMLLLGNITGKYVFSAFYYGSLKELNIDAFSKENQDLLKALKSNFAKYIVNNNKRKNIFAERIKFGASNIKDLSKDIDEENLIKDFEKVLEGENADIFKPETITNYIMKVIGTYSKEDIKNNFDFILYDLDSNNKDGLEDRRKRYLLYSSLSNEQIRKIDEIGILKKRLQEINGQEANKLSLRLNRIEGSLAENITELEDIYGDYEILYRQDLISNLCLPKEDITIIENYKDMKPQLIHRFIRSTEKFRDMEIKKIKERIISERADKDTSEDLTKEEQERLNKMINQVDTNLDQYKVNYTTDGKGTSYNDSLGLDSYLSDTSNQISASVYAGMEFVNSASFGIIGIGFNGETLTPEAIAISSNNYKTTNKGLNNLEYDEENEFKEMSAPLSEMIKANGKSEVVMHRRGMDFDTKASYIFATIDSSNEKQTNEIMKQLEQIREEEGLKIVIYDVSKIKESINKEEQQNLIDSRA